VTGRYRDAVTTLTYLDHAATTPMRPEAVAAMAPFFTERFANPSGSHAFARAARRAVDDARDTIAAVVGCQPGEIVFTSGGTEADNAAIFGAVRRHGGLAVCPAAEHHAVLQCVEHLGGPVVGVDSAGRVDLDQLLDTVRTAADTVRVVSVMAVNNEVGSVSPLDRVARIVRLRAPEAVLHTDAVQAPCWQDLRMLWPHVDVMSLSAHKFGGPKGVGVMVVRQGVSLEPLLFGGGQERDRRSGTHNVAGIVATAAALAATDAQRACDLERIAALRARLVEALVSRLDGVDDTLALAAGEPGTGVAGIAHMSLAGVESEALLFLLDRAGVCASAASACASGALAGSHVLAAMGVDSQRSAGALRLSLGHTTTAADIDRAIDVIVDAVTTLRRRSTAGSVA
jgi:cysteine desulfurase